MASAVVSFATSMKLPLSTTYVTFMVSMGTSLSDQAWGRESAVYRITGVLAVVGGWFFTAFMAFTVSFIFASVIFNFKIAGTVALLLIVLFIIIRSYRFHFKKQKEELEIDAFAMENTDKPEVAIKTTFEQTGYFLKEISNTLDSCFDAAFYEDRQRLKNIKIQVKKIEKWTDIIISNIFNTLNLIQREDVNDSQKYLQTIRALRDITESHKDIITKTYEHFENNHSGMVPEQKEELGAVKVSITRLLWNTSIMLLQRKKVDYDYITRQSLKLDKLVDNFDRNQIKRIQDNETKIRLSILFYGFMDNCVKISQQTHNLLDIYRTAFVTGNTEKQG